MAAPPEDLRAHDSGSNTPCQGQKLHQAGGKLLAAHIVGVTPECRVPPTGVRSVRGRPATASQVRKPDVIDSRSVERGLEERLLILRLASGAGKAPNIGDLLDPIRREHLEKVSEWAGGVSHG